MRINGLLETDDIARTVTKLVETNTCFNLKNIFGRDSKKAQETILQGTEEIYLAIRKCVKNLFFGNSRISENVLQTILYNYSNDYFVSAMQDELTGFFSDAVVTILPTVLSRIGQPFFDVETFQKECDKHKEFVGVDSIELLKKMFNDGYLGQHRPKESKEYTVFKYRNPRETFIEDHECIVHKRLMRSLTIG